jgi:tRNA 2-selenouridine synthase
MPQILKPSEFLSASGVILDVRSPAEYVQGHIPGAESFPLFDNEERAQIGICYKQQGQEPAIELGLAIAGPKLASFVSTAKTLAWDRAASPAANRQVRVHCWRGGMRSSSMATLLETAGLKVSVLEGGYKAFRRWVRSTLALPKSILMLGGMTGTGKTAILAALAAQGEQVLDLEHLANHRGSSYGNLTLPAQPSTEHFENQIALQWAAFNSQKPVWIEAESQRIGTCRIPDEVFHLMANAPVFEVQRSHSERIALLKQMYGIVNIEELVIATERIRKRLGGLRTQQVIELIHKGEAEQAIDLVLDYYDKTYRYDLQRREVPIQTVDVTGLSAWESATLLSEKADFYRNQY